MYVVSYMVNELHLNYFVMILTLLITTIATCLISLVLRLFGINDSIENDKKIIMYVRRDKQNLESEKMKGADNKLILRYNKND